MGDGGRAQKVIPYLHVLLLERMGMGKNGGSNGEVLTKGREQRVILVCMQWGDGACTFNMGSRVHIANRGREGGGGVATVGGGDQV